MALAVHIISAVSGIRRNGPFVVDARTGDRGRRPAAGGRLTVTAASPLTPPRR